MIQKLQSIFFPLLSLLAIAFCLFLINQISGLYLLIDSFNPTAAIIVLASVSIVSISLIVYPLLIFWRMPPPLIPPKNSSEISQYQNRLVQRLASNTILRQKNYVVKSPSDLAEAMKILDREAAKTIKETATVIFLTTSISQNGKLDAFTVLGAQLRMTWKISKIYYQRPTLKEIGRLYSFVGASSFLAYELEDLDITRQIEPVATALFKNASGRSVPLIGPAATLIMDSLLEGSTNAFLSLRVGILTRKYCSTLGVLDRKQTKKDTLKEAAKELRIVSVDASAKVITGLLSATKNAGMETLKNSWEGVKKTGHKFTETIKTPFNKKADKKEPEAEI